MIRINALVVHVIDSHTEWVESTYLFRRKKREKLQMADPADTDYWGEILQSDWDAAREECESISSILEGMDSRGWKFEIIHPVSVEI